jgi:hypothetical protein
LRRRAPRPSLVFALVLPYKVAGAATREGKS